MLIIDGHNLIGRSPGLSLQREAEAREAVLRQVAGLAARRRDTVIVVFDGDRPGSAKEQRFGGLRVVYAAAGRTADDEIVRLLARGNPRAASVVTSDRGLAERARSLGAGVEGVEAFRRRIQTGPKPTSEKPEAGGDDVDYWLRQFSPRPKDGQHNI